MRKVLMDDLAVRDLRPGGVDDRQQHVVAHDREPLLVPPQENAKAITGAGVVIHRPHKLVADVP
jgi:hypothetical protein